MTIAPLVVCIVGPTACHKTEVSIRLAHLLDGEIISADSVAIYRGLDIGSAKPSETEKDGIPHHMINVTDVTDTHFTVAEFRNLAQKEIDDVIRHGKLPIVVGGSGLYSDSIFSDMSFSTPSDSTIRTRLESEYCADPEAVYDRLRSVDPDTASRLHINDAKRVIRALEVYETSGRPFSTWNRDFSLIQNRGDKYHVLRYGLNMDRALLYERINRRVDRMFEAGLKEEAYALFEKGYTREYPALQSIGYAQLYDAYQGLITLDEAKNQIKQATRRFAKRQLTWFRRNTETKWFFLDHYQSIEEVVSTIKEDIIRYDG